ncbi:MAG: hypothetical protein ABI683_09600 [Ginsengibacter sp.]
MKIDEVLLKKLASLLLTEQLINNEEGAKVTGVSSDHFPFSKQLTTASSIHFHIHVNDIRDLPHGMFRSYHGEIVNSAEGYIKYAFDNGINFIFSHIPVAQHEKNRREENQPYLDHIGIDIRSEEKEAYIIFQQIPLVSAENDYLFTRQGDGKDSVKCCHMQVKEKYWVYPDGDLNYEFAFGPLVINEGGAFGVDLRPANPHNKMEESASCCSEVKTKSAIFIQ